MSDDESTGEKSIEFLFVAPDEHASSIEAPRSEWSSLEVSITVENEKKSRYKQGLYEPGSGEVCAKYLRCSDSSVFRHLYYNYPAVSDPGIKQALLSPEKPVIYPDDGQAVYLSQCKEMNIAPARLFYKTLLTPEINMKYYGVKPQAVRAMARALKYNPIVTRFDLTGNFLNDDACYHLGRMLETNATLTELILEGCRIGASGILRLGDALHTNRTLVFLHIGNNTLGEEGGMHFAEQIYRGARVLKVNLSKNQLGRQSALAFTDVWEFKNKFTHLDLSWNNFFHAPTTCKMLDQLAQSSYLQELNLSFNGLQGERMAHSINNILMVPTLVALDLSRNMLQKEAIEAIVPFLFKARKLATLNLSFNPMTPEDAFSVLHKMLRPRIKIMNLLMEGICVEKPFMDLLARVKRMKSRKDFQCTYGNVLHNWEVTGPDARELILQRAQYLGKASKKKKVDTALYFLAIAKEYARPIPIKEMIERIENDAVPLDDDFLNGLALVFAGPKTPKSATINFELIKDYIQRVWPDKKLPPTPPPEPEPEVIIAPPPKAKGKGKGKK